MQTSVGSAGGCGGLRTKRSGCSAYADVESPLAKFADLLGTLTALATRSARDEDLRDRQGCEGGRRRRSPVRWAGVSLC